jgi:hypothetical protein
MKKLIVLFSALIALSSCNVTTSHEDTQMLQSWYQTVYQVNFRNYVTIDSTGVYHIIVTSDGQIKATVKIK